MRPGRERVGPAWREYLEAAGLVGLASGVCFAVREHLQTTDVAMLYLLAVVTVAARCRQRAALLATVLAIAAFDLLFVPPYYTFAVRNAAYFLTFGVMLAVALVMSRLTARIRAQADEAAERERRTAALYAMSGELADAADRREQLAVIVRHIGRAAGGHAVVALDGGGAPDGSEPAWPDGGVFDSVDARVAVRWAYEHGEAAGSGTTRCADAEVLAVPLRTTGARLGVVLARPKTPDRPFDSEQRRTIEAMADHAAAALERTMLAERHDAARLEVEAERLRTALLSSLSHDLRTPLGSIEGAASSLLLDDAALSVETRRELVETILEESRRMTRLVGNLLDMVRVEAGGLAMQKSWQPLEEALGVALLRLEDRLAQHPVSVRLPPDLPLVPIDELLVEQVLINLLENAAKHTPPETEVTITAWVDGGAIVVEVADRGPGLPRGAEEAVFQKFYRGGAGSHSPGAGLGLAICRGIVAAHGGRIWAERRGADGTAFRFSLPLEGPPVAALPPDVVEA